MRLNAEEDDEIGLCSSWSILDLLTPAMAGQHKALLIVSGFERPGSRVFIVIGRDFEA
jgi:hypothetical protein